MLRTLEKIPWFAVAGALVIVNLLIGTQGADFMSTIVPSYLTQALLYIALGFSFISGKTDRGFAVFLMAGLWLLANIVLWSNVANSVLLWLLFVGQLGLTYMFFTGQSIRFAGGGGASWMYAALWLVFLFGLGKFIIGLSSGLTLAQLPLWGLGILLMSFGYIVEPVEKSWATPLQAIGCLLAVVAALTLTTPGLQLLP